MKTKTRFVLYVISLFAWMISTIVFVPTVYAASAGKGQSSVALASGSDDPDHDGLTNAQEKACGTNPKKADSNSNGISDGADDKDHDGLSNKAEFEHGTKCKSKDSDRDGISDGFEVEHGTDPGKADKQSGNGRNKPEDTPHPEDH